MNTRDKNGDPNFKLNLVQIGRHYNPRQSAKKKPTTKRVSSTITENLQFSTLLHVTSKSSVGIFLLLLQ
jgi:hypothetical protein